MCFIPIARGDCVQSSVQWLFTTDFITCKKDACLLNYFLQLCIIQWIHLTFVFVDILRKRKHILQKSRLVSILYGYIVAVTQNILSLNIIFFKLENTIRHCYRRYWNRKWERSLVNLCFYFSLSCTNRKSCTFLFRYDRIVIHVTFQIPVVWIFNRCKLVDNEVVTNLMVIDDKHL